MTVDEEIENLKYLISDDCTDTASDYIEEIEMAIKALEEIQQYRKIGTVEECREAVDRQKPKKPILKNGESGMFVDYADGHGEYKVTKWQDWVCPVCGWFVGQRYNAIRHGSKPHPHDQRKCKYCNRCGTRIDWSEDK